MRRDLMAAVTIPPAETGDIVVRFGGSPADWWPGPTRGNANAWQVEVRLGRLRRPVIATIGDCWVDGLTTWRSLSWTPVRMLDGRLQPDPRLPGFTGSLGLRRPDDRPAVLLLQGVYCPLVGGSALPWTTCCCTPWRRGQPSSCCGTSASTCSRVTMRPSRPRWRPTSTS